MPDTVDATAKTAARLVALMRHFCLRALSLPRVCPRRACRRHRCCEDLCLEDGDDPRCLSALHPIDRRALERLLDVVIDIHNDTLAPCRPDDIAQADRIEEALAVLYSCCAIAPGLTPRIDAWVARYDAPPKPPTPPVDTAAVLAEMRAALAQDSATAARVAASGATPVPRMTSW